MAMNLKLFLVLSFTGLCDFFASSEGKSLELQRSGLKLVIDQDGGADDAMAVVMCILYERYFNGMEVVGITTTHGNVNETQGFENTQRFLDLTDRRDIPIYRGATQSLVISVPSDFYFGYNGLGDNLDYPEVKSIPAQKKHAANALIELSKKYKGKLVVMAIGPLTNIALAQRLDPGFIGRLAQLYVGGGHIQNEANPDPEFNAEQDVEAYRIMADSASVDRVTLIPFSEIKSSLNLTKEWRINVLGGINTPITKSLLSFERLSLASPSKKWTLLDPAVAAIVLEPSLVEEFTTAKNNITLCGAERGLNTNILGSDLSNMRLVYSANKEAYKKFLIDVFSAELDDCGRRK